MATTADINLTNRKKRLRIRAWRRGMKEMDLILGNFVDALDDSVDEDTISSLEKLIERPDQELYKIISSTQYLNETELSHYSAKELALLRKIRSTY